MMRFQPLDKSASTFKNNHLLASSLEFMFGRGAYSILAIDSGFFVCFFLFFFSSFFFHFWHRIIGTHWCIILNLPTTSDTHGQIQVTEVQKLEKPKNPKNSKNRSLHQNR